MIFLYIAAYLVLGLIATHAVHWSCQRQSGGGFDDPAHALTFLALWPVTLGAAIVVVVFRCALPWKGK